MNCVDKGIPKTSCDWSAWANYSALVTTSSNRIKDRSPSMKPIWQRIDSHIRERRKVMVREVGQDKKPEKMPTRRVWQLGGSGRPSRMGQSPQNNQRNNTEAGYCDPLNFHTTTDHGGGNNAMRKQNDKIRYTFIVLHRHIVVVLHAARD